MPVVAHSTARLRQDPRHGGERQHVVDDAWACRTGPGCAGSGGLARTDAALALEAFEQRGLFAADVGARRPAAPRGRTRAAAEHRRRVARRAAIAIASTIVAMASRILGAEVDDPCVAPTAIAGDEPCPRSSRNGSPSISMRSAKVPLSPSSALQTMYFWSAARRSTVRHLMPVGKPAPPRPRRPDATTSSTNRRGAIAARARGPPSRRARDIRRATADR